MNCFERSWLPLFLSFLVSGRFFLGKPICFDTSSRLFVGAILEVATHLHGLSYARRKSIRHSFALTKAENLFVSGFLWRLFWLRMQWSSCSFDSQCFASERDHLLLWTGSLIQGSQKERKFQVGMALPHEAHEGNCHQILAFRSSPEPGSVIHCWNTERRILFLFRTCSCKNIAQSPTLLASLAGTKRLYH